MVDEFDSTPPKIDYTKTVTIPDSPKYSRNPPPDDDPEASNLSPFGNKEPKGVISLLTPADEGI